MKWRVTGCVAVAWMCAGGAAQAQPLGQLGMRCEAQRVPSSGATVARSEAKDVADAPLPAEADPCVSEKPVPKPAAKSVRVRTIVIDPGHGGENEGAIGVARIHEKYLTLQVAQLLADRLRELLPDVEIVLTRQRDESLSLSERIEVANRLNADLFLSLHFNNSLNPDAIGFESFWVGDYWAADMQKAGEEITDEIRESRTRAGAASERMGRCFNHAMRRRFDVLDRGVKPGDYTVLTRAKVPAVVLEMAFLSHAEEGMSAVRPEYQARLVQALTDAVMNYVNGL